MCQRHAACWKMSTFYLLFTENHFRIFYFKWVPTLLNVSFLSSQTKQLSNPFIEHLVLITPVLLRKRRLPWEKERIFHLRWPIAQGWGKEHGLWKNKNKEPPKPPEPVVSEPFAYWTQIINFTDKREHAFRKEFSYSFTDENFGEIRSRSREMDWKLPIYSF